MKPRWSEVGRIAKAVGPMSDRHVRLTVRLNNQTMFALLPDVRHTSGSIRGHGSSWPCGAFPKGESVTSHLSMEGGSLRR